MDYVYLLGNPIQALLANHDYQMLDHTEYREAGDGFYFQPIIDGRGPNRNEAEVCASMIRMRLPELFKNISFSVTVEELNDIYGTTDEISNISYIIVVKKN